MPEYLLRSVPETCSERRTDRGRDPSKSRIINILINEILEFSIGLLITFGLCRQPEIGTDHGVPSNDAG